MLRRRSMVKGARCQLNHQGRYSLKPSQEATQLRLIRLSKPLQNWFPH